jgi:serine/threonine protein kinase
MGIALGLRFARGLGLLHPAVKGSNILFDADRRIQIADFSPIRLETGEVEPFSREGWAPTAGVSAFVSLLCEIAGGAPVTRPIGAADGPPLPAAERKGKERQGKERKGKERKRKERKEKKRKGKEKKRGAVSAGSIRE